MRRLSLRKLMVVCAALAAALAAWLLFAPQAVGGSVAYLVVNGTSMKPSLSGGDLVVVRAAGRYSDGDVVAYRSPVAGKTFVHRIIRADKGRFTLKGDANAFPDAGRPRSSAIYGKVWFTLPHVGGALGWLAAPVHAAVVGGLLVLLLSGGGGTAVQRRRRRRVANLPEATPAVVNWEQPTIPLFAGRWATSVLFGSGAALVVLGALALVAFSRPATTELVRQVSYRENGSFAYWADVPAGVAYPDGRVDTGEPVFLQLVDKLRTRFEYRLQAEADLNTRGRIVLVAVISDAGGWQRQLALGPSSQFEGGLAAVSGTLDLRRLRRLVADLERATGVAHESYTITLAPAVDLGGSLAGVEVSDRFAPTLQFRLDRLTLAPDQSLREKLSPARSGFVQTHVRRPGALSAGGLAVPVVTLRRISLAGGLALLLIFSVVAFLRSRALRGGEPFRIEARYGHLLVPVSAAASEALGPLVEVATMDGLVRLAEPGKRPILHSERLGAHAYYVEDGGVVYSYSSGRAEELGPEQEEKAARLRLLRRQA